MIALALALLLNAPPPSIVIVPPELSTEEATAKYQSDCQGAAAKSIACKHLQWQLEYALWQDLEGLADSGVPIDDESLDVGAAADCPQLKSFALDQIYHRGNLSKTEDALVVAAFNDPYPMVRESAALLLGQVHDSKWTHALVRRGDATTASKARFPTPDSIPSEADLGVPIFTGATYQYFASDDSRAVYVTTQPADKVLAWYSAKGKKAIAPADLHQRAAAGKQAAMSRAQNAAMADPNAMMKVVQQAMQQGKDPQQAMMEWSQQQQQPLMALDLDWTEQMEREDGVEKPQYVSIEETKIGSVSVPSKLVMVFTDSVLGGTTLVVHRRPAVPAAPTTEQLQRQAKMSQQLANDPLAAQVWSGREDDEP